MRNLANILLLALFLHFLYSCSNDDFYVNEPEVEISETKDLKSTFQSLTVEARSQGGSTVYVSWRTSNTSASGSATYTVETNFATIASGISNGSRSGGFFFNTLSNGHYHIKVNYGGIKGGCTYIRESDDPSYGGQLCLCGHGTCQISTVNIGERSSTLKYLCYWGITGYPGSMPERLNIDIKYKLAGKDYSVNEVVSLGENNLTITYPFASYQNIYLEAAIRCPLHWTPTVGGSYCSFYTPMP